MGVIQRQAIKGTVITYLAVIIGFVNTALFMPKLSTEIVGLINILLTYTVVITIIGRLGFGQVTTKMFAYFRDDKKQHNGFMFLAIIVTIVGFIISVIIILFIKLYFSKYRPASDLFSTYVLYLIPLVFFHITFSMLDQYYKVIYKAVRGVFLREFVQKLGTLIAVAIMIYGSISLDDFVLLYVIGFCFPGFLMILLALKEKQLQVKPQLQFIDKSYRKQIFSVGAFGILSGASGIIALNVDRMMIESMLNLSETGVYSIAFYFGALIAIPSRSLLKISSAVISESWKNNDVDNIKLVYEKSTINQFIIGALLLIGIIVNFDNIFEILGADYLGGKMVMLLIGFAFLLDMAVGVSGSVLMNSKYYRSVSYLMFAFVLFIILSNVIFIPKYGIIGAAIATLLSKFLFNFSKVIMVWHYFKMQPFNYKFIVVGLVSGFLVFLNSLTPQIDNLVLDIGVRSAIVSVVYIALIYVLRVSVDISDAIDKVWLKLQSQFK